MAYVESKPDRLIAGAKKRSKKKKAGKGPKKLRGQQKGSRLIEIGD
jgi:hypothetical protein